MANDTRLPRGLGVMSLGLGAAQLIAPDDICRAIGVEPTSRRTTLARAVGARELGHAALLLGSNDPVPGTWSRVAGDVLDIGLLVAAMGSRGVRRNRLALVILGLLAIAAVDLKASLAATKASQDATVGTRRAAGTGQDAAAQNGRRVRQAITVDRPREEAYAFWRDLERLPTFMEHLESVEVRPDGRSHWRAKAPAGMSVEWDAEIVEEVPNERLAWRSIEGSRITNHGSVEFRRAPRDQGTEVVVDLTYEPPAGPLGSIVAKLLGEEPALQVSDDLRRFKQILEVGEVVRSDASITGRRGQRPAHPMKPPEAAEARGEATSGATSGAMS